tara:strand:- start:597 stop:824 length:228 start_codon:yes stop_codon:yes gene_type:complete
MKNKYKKVFEKVFGKDPSIEKISIDKHSKWDSLRHFDLIANLEKEFNIEFKPNDIMKLKSFKEGISILKKYKIKI